MACCVYMHDRWHVTAEIQLSINKGDLEPTGAIATFCIFIVHMVGSL